jgi:hypothetical protein
MKEKILTYIISTVVEVFLSSLSEDQIKRELDRFIDRMEELISDSSNQLDDGLLPVLKFFREVFDVPDRD